MPEVEGTPVNEDYRQLASAIGEAETEIVRNVGQKRSQYNSAVIQNPGLIKLLEQTGDCEKGWEIKLGIPFGTADKPWDLHWDKFDPSSIQAWTPNTEYKDIEEGKLGLHLYPEKKDGVTVLQVGAVEHNRSTGATTPLKLPETIISQVPPRVVIKGLCSTFKQMADGIRQDGYQTISHSGSFQHAQLMLQLLQESREHMLKQIK